VPAYCCIRVRMQAATDAQANCWPEPLLQVYVPAYCCIRVRMQAATDAQANCWPEPLLQVYVPAYCCIRVRMLVYGRAGKLLAGTVNSGIRARILLRTCPYATIYVYVYVCIVV
jgi:hypothetical protein